MKKYAVIVAGGSGTRMGGSVPKQFLHVRGKPVLWHTLEAFLRAYSDLQIILILAEDYFETGREIIQRSSDPNRIAMASGGKSRFDSVRNGLVHVPNDSIVFVHDGVRCLVTVTLITRCFEKAKELGNAIPAIAPVDSLRIQNTSGNKILDRHEVRLIQTPQTFYSDILKTAYEQEFDRSLTDDASVAEKSGIRIHLVEGEETNIKITRPLDLIIAEKILEERLNDVSSP